MSESMSESMSELENVRITVILEYLSGNTSINSIIAATILQIYCKIIGENVLLEFKIKNYKSFVNETSFSMVAAPKQTGLDYSLMNLSPLIEVGVSFLLKDFSIPDK